MSNNQGTGYEVRNIEQIDNKNIRLGKTFKYGGDYHLTNLYYLAEGDATVLVFLIKKNRLLDKMQLMKKPNSLFKHL